MRIRIQLAARPYRPPRSNSSRSMLVLRALNVGQPERATQNRVIALFRDERAYLIGGA